MSVSPRSYCEYCEWIGTMAEYMGHTMTKKHQKNVDSYETSKSKRLEYCKSYVMHYCKFCDYTSTYPSMITHKKSLKHKAALENQTIIYKPAAKYGKKLIYKSKEEIKVEVKSKNILDYFKNQD